MNYEHANQFIRALNPVATLTLDESAQALCAQTDPDAFFPEKGGKTTDAKKVCAKCDIRLRCLEVAVINGERDGVFGGMSERQRRPLVQAYREQNGVAA